jgi:hypothetical protein
MRKSGSFLSMENLDVEDNDDTLSVPDEIV